MTDRTRRRLERIEADVRLMGYDKVSRIEVDGLRRLVFAFMEQLGWEGRLLPNPPDRIEFTRKKKAKVTP